MSDKGVCLDCGRESLLDDCAQECSHDEDYCNIELDYECPHCYGPVEEVIEEKKPSVIMEKVRRKVDSMVNAVYCKYYRSVTWVNDAIRPGRQREYRSKIMELRSTISNQEVILMSMRRRISELDEAVKKDILSAVDMLARNIDVSIRELHVPRYSGIASYIGEYDELEPIEINQVVLEKRAVLARMDILDCHELKRIKMSSKESLAMYARLVADGLSHVLTKFVLKELMEDLTDE